MIPIITKFLDDLRFLEDYTSLMKDYILWLKDEYPDWGTLTAEFDSLLELLQDFRKHLNDSSI